MGDAPYSLDIDFLHPQGRRSVGPAMVLAALLLCLVGLGVAEWRLAVRAGRAPVAVSAAVSAVSAAATAAPDPALQRVSQELSATPDAFLTTLERCGTGAVLASVKWSSSGDSQLRVELEGADAVAALLTCLNQTASGKASWRVASLEAVEQQRRVWVTLETLRVE